eukprot:g6871.t1
MSGNNTLFADGCANYAKFRRTYSETLFDTIFSFGNHDNSLAVDLATGTGQVISRLAPKFSHIKGVDISKNQIEHATPHSNVSFRVGKAEEFINVASLEQNSVDLITVAMGLHWFDLNSFYKECRRALKPNGTFAAWSYGLWTHPSNPKADTILEDLRDNVLGPYWKQEAKHCWNSYVNLIPSMEHFTIKEHIILEEKVKMTMRQSIGYLSTWSAYNIYCQKNSDDPLIPFSEETMKALDLKNYDEEFEIDWPVAMILAKQPIPFDKA